MSRSRNLTFQLLGALLLSPYQPSESLPKLLDPDHVPESQTNPRLSSRLASCERCLVSQQIPVGNAILTQILVDIHLADPVQTVSVKLPSCNQ